MGFSSSVPEGWIENHAAKKAQKKRVAIKLPLNYFKFIFKFL
jgi:hypothetical protein